MTHVLGELIPYAVGVALSPLPLIALFLVLRAPAARPASAAFLAGRLIVVFALALIVAFLAEAVPESSGRSPFLSWLRIVLGLALMLWGIAKIVRRPRTEADAALPGWMASIERVTVPGALRLSVILSLANVKELAFGVGAGLTIAAGDLGAGPTVVATLVYTAISCAALIVAVVAFWVAEDRVSGPLDAARGWLVRNNKVIIGGVLLVIGSILVGEGVASL